MGGYAPRQLAVLTPLPLLRVPLVGGALEDYWKI